MLQIKPNTTQLIKIKSLSIVMALQCFIQIPKKVLNGLIIHEQVGERIVTIWA